MPVAANEQQISLTKHNGLFSLAAIAQLFHSHRALDTATADVDNLSGESDI
jgi:hypothetical protein